MLNDLMKEPRNLGLKEERETRNAQFPQPFPDPWPETILGRLARPLPWFSILYIYFLSSGRKSMLFWQNMS